jgi:hypothetical protein
MNIALGAVLIFILLIPPVAFYLSYTFHKHSRGGLSFSFLDGLLASAILALLLHSFFIGLMMLFGIEVRFDLLLKLVGGDLHDLDSTVSNRILGHSLLKFAGYNLFMLAIMIIGGRKLHQLSVKKKWHIKNDLFRIYNNWWYLFNGYHLEEEEYVQIDYDAPPVADVVVDTGSGTIIYSGLLTSYVCKGEELDRIYLRSAIRRDFLLNARRPADKKPADEQHDIKEITGDFLVIAYSQIKNLNLRFVTLPDPEEYLEKLQTTPDATDEIIIDDAAHITAQPG